MNCPTCTCPANSPRVVLEDGREVSSWCRLWLAETWARHREVLRILGLPDKESRRAAIAAVRLERGDVAADRLEAAVRDEWAARQARLMAGAA